MPDKSNETAVFLTNRHNLMRHSTCKPNERPRVHSTHKASHTQRPLAGSVGALPITVVKLGQDSVLQSLQYTKTAAGKMALVAPPAPTSGSQTAFTYSSEPQAVPPKRTARSKYREDAPEMPPDPQWMDENEVRRCMAWCVRVLWSTISKGLLCSSCGYHAGSPSMELAFASFTLSRVP